MVKTTPQERSKTKLLQMLFFEAHNWQTKETLNLCVQLKLVSRKLARFEAKENFKKAQNIRSKNYPQHAAGIRVFLNRLALWLPNVLFFFLSDTISQQSSKASNQKNGTKFAKVNSNGLLRTLHSSKSHVWNYIKSSFYLYLL